MFEGDLVRPLGWMTLNFGYAEAEVNFIIARLSQAGVDLDVPPTAPLGQRLKALSAIFGQLHSSASAEALAILEESGSLIEKRNSLVHACVLAGGKVQPNDSAKPQFSVTPEALMALGDQLFNWKERLSAAVQLRLLPFLHKDRT
jgi:hypothetical protein